MGIFDAALLASAIGLSIPILLAATGELVSERAGVLNVGLEGMMLSGAFLAYYLAWETGSLVVGVLGGVLGGLIFGALMAFLAVQYGADQVVSGVGINILAVGATTFAFNEVFGDLGSQALDRIGDLPIPLLADTALGHALFGQDPLAYFAILSIPISWLLLYRTTWGISIRGAGEFPAAVDAAGVNVNAVRWMATLFAAGMAGLAGAYLSIVEVGIFRQEMSAGRGFLALTAVIFGRWHPWGVVGACLLFGGADALQLRLQVSGTLPREVWALIAIVMIAIPLIARFSPRLGGSPRRSAAICLPIAAAAVALFLIAPAWSLPHQLWLALPFVLALVALASTSGRARMPTALTIAYRRE